MLLVQGCLTYHTPITLLIVDSEIKIAILVIGNSKLHFFGSKEKTEIQSMDFFSDIYKAN